MGNFLAMPSALAAVILSLLCLSVIVMLYWSEDDAALRKTFLGMIICFVIQTGLRSETKMMKTGPFPAMRD